VRFSRPYAPDPTRPFDEVDVTQEENAELDQR
jgi:hypothetical protein